MASVVKDRYRLTTFANIRDGIGDVFHNMADRVRYLDDLQTDSNVSRQTLHPLWQAVQHTLDADLRAYRSGLTPGQVRELARLEAMRNYERNILGNAIGYGVALGIEDGQMEEELPDAIGCALIDAITDPSGRFHDSIKKARKRHHFIPPHFQ